MNETVSSSKPTAIQLLAERFTGVRELSLWLCKPLLIEDYGLQAVPEVSPPKWHLAHTTWFFETFILKRYQPDYQVYHPEFEHLFNSYYQGVGPQFGRPLRGLLSRPTLEQIEVYRQHVDANILVLLESSEDIPAIVELVELGINHEQQHQELLLTDIKHNFSFNPLSPRYSKNTFADTNEPVAPLKWIAFEQHQFTQGFAGKGFHFDNETPAHEVVVHPFKMANRLITNQEFLQFIEDGGYNNPLLWLSDGWAAKNHNHWSSPLYWRYIDGDWKEFTLHGLHSLNLNLPVTHISYYEADAFARWAGKALPSETQWEFAKSCNQADKSHLLIKHNNYVFHPSAANANENVSQLFGSCWEWTQSAYLPYPGYQPLPGAVGEYNGKFMCNQMVLKGGSCATPHDHIRRSYRNFFYPKDRWQFSGIRLVD
ncbi:ergothioneine biosynthesis protein EgtB [Alteromonas sp. ASW11-130]|uniref:ergothioneine biosynthesis protein EgtB n=1 Tax=Alteromonas sp. ASW11-130 TaxID=3015775 RepID=UPI002241ACF4|nr:ergothioneine biosynthesis protein EgtB [Alteromonas sp. ASW11-130]MCW8092350.1 ergothioneine biosynthesis protein EgtB [Alteromonas sp. ASW11-130]